MAATHIVEAKKAQALRDLADTMQQMTDDIAALKQQMDRIEAMLQAEQRAKPGKSETK